MDTNDRFWLKVDKRSASKCWPWVGSTDAFGYGVLFRSKITLPHIYRAHRLSWEIHNGPIPTGMHVLHHCDNPPCVNPRHLWLGTQADNNRDRDRKGRGGAKGGHVADRRGTKNGNAKLSDEQIVAIRVRYLGRGIGPSQQAIADEFGVAQSQVSRILRGEQRT